MVVSTGEEIRGRREREGEETNERGQLLEAFHRRHLRRCRLHILVLLLPLSPVLSVAEKLPPQLAIDEEILAVIGHGGLDVARFGVVHKRDHLEVVLIVVLVVMVVVSVLRRVVRRKRVGTWKSGSGVWRGRRCGLRGRGSSAIIDS